MIRRVQSSSLLLIIFIFFWPQLGEQAKALSQCPDSFLHPKIVQTPKAATDALQRYVGKIYKNNISVIDAKSMYRAGSWWSSGWHTCYFVDQKVASGFSGFLPKGVNEGFETGVVLKKEVLSGGTTIFIRYFRANGKWIVVDSGTGP